MGVKRNILNFVVVVLFFFVGLSLYLDNIIVASILGMVLFAVSFWRKYFYDFLRMIGV